jgi:stearoyl-CoA desaturase (delta-9 desaturase)
MLALSTLFEKHIYKWAIDHRIHHKYCDTKADPHHTARGLFFAHVS